MKVNIDESPADIVNRFVTQHQVDDTNTPYLMRMVVAKIAEIKKTGIWRDVIEKIKGKYGSVTELMATLAEKAKKDKAEAAAKRKKEEE